MLSKFHMCSFLFKSPCYGDQEPVISGSEMQWYLPTPLFSRQKRNGRKMFILKMTKNYHALNISSKYQKYAPCLFQTVWENTSMEGGEMRDRKRMRERERVFRAQVYFAWFQNTLVDTYYIVWTWTSNLFFFSLLFPSCKVGYLVELSTQWSLFFYGYLTL